MATSPAPGEGTIAALQARSDKCDTSAHAKALVQRQLERDGLRELIEDSEAEHGPVDPAAVVAKQALLRGAADSRV
jgi:hypothetical protein